jgi:hypothetical protein
MPQQRAAAHENASATCQGAKARAQPRRGRATRQARPPTQRRASAQRARRRTWRRASSVRPGGARTRRRAPKRGFACAALAEGASAAHQQARGRVHDRHAAAPRARLPARGGAWRTRWARALTVSMWQGQRIAHARPLPRCASGSAPQLPSAWRRQTTLSAALSAEIPQRPGARPASACGEEASGVPRLRPGASRLDPHFFWPPNFQMARQVWIEMSIQAGRTWPHW